MDNRPVFDPAGCRDFSDATDLTTEEAAEIYALEMPPSEEGAHVE